MKIMLPLLLALCSSTALAQAPTAQELAKSPLLKAETGIASQAAQPKGPPKPNRPDELAPSKQTLVQPAADQQGAVLQKKAKRRVQ
jgi:hypothetical protein